VLKSSHEINNGSLNKMGFIKIDNKWVSKEEDFGGPSAGTRRNTSAVYHYEFCAARF